MNKSPYYSVGYTNILIIFYKLKYNKIKSIPLSEIKLGLNLAKNMYETTSTDTSYSIKIKQNLCDIDNALKSFDLDQILNCNSQITSQYGHILIESGKFSYRTESFLIEQGIIQNFYCLKEIGEELKKQLFIDNLRKELLATSKSIANYILDKLVENINHQALFYS